MMRAMMLTSALLVGCSDMAVSESLDMNAGDVSDSDGYTEVDFDGRLRIDVLPTVAINEELEPQSFWLDEQPSWQDIDADLQPTVEITGSVIGFSANPYGVQVPGTSDVPVLGKVTVYQPDTIVSSTVQTDDNGEFSIRLPAGEGYRIAALPTEPPDLPFYIESDIAMFGNTDLGDISLGYGDPIYGNVHNSADEAIDCTVRLIDAVTGIEGGATQTDASGFYMLRAEPGAYIVQIEPATGNTLPTIREPVSFEEGTGGAQVDISVGEIIPVLVSGIPHSASGQTMYNAIVRLTSVALAQSTGSMVVETETNQSGEFLVYALPGEWTLEIIPPAEISDLTAPLEQAIQLDGSDTSLGIIPLTEQISLLREVLTADGYPAANVLVTFIERGFNNATYTGYTDESGMLEILVPDVHLDVRLTPTATTASAVTRRELLNPAADTESIWSLSPGVSIAGQVSRPDGATGFSVIEVYNDTGVFYGSALTEADGSFNFSISP
ncbi:MAG: hypothetical protein ACI8RZ_002648 [Myxococcota bacterium]|jgi:hypothetical protein